jgi:hypothetical protein
VDCAVESSDQFPEIATRASYTGEICRYEPKSLRGDSLQRAEVLRNVDGVLLQHSQIDHLERSSICGGKYHRRSRPGLMGLKPTLRNHAPAIPGLQTRKAVLGHWRDQVIPDAPLLVEEFRGYHRAHQMDCLIWSGAATAIAIEACDWFRSAGLQFAAEDIAFTLHSTSLADLR